MDPPIRELIEIGGIHYRIPGCTSRDILREIVHATACIPRAARPALFEKIWERESLGSTGIGNGIAMLHPMASASSPNPSVPSCVGLYFPDHPVEFGSLDRKKVKAFFLLVLSTPQEHLLTLSRLIRLLNEDSLVNLLHSIPPRNDVLAEIVRLEGALFPEGPIPRHAPQQDNRFRTP